LALVQLVMSNQKEKDITNRLRDRVNPEDKKWMDEYMKMHMDNLKNDEQEKHPISFLPVIPSVMAKMASTEFVSISPVVDMHESSSQREYEKEKSRLSSWYGPLLRLWRKVFPKKYGGFYMEATYTREEDPIEYEVTSKNIRSVRNRFRTKDIQVGDRVVPWDSGGWLQLAGRRGLQIERDGKVVHKILTAMS
jgi:hypothetical protein